jgi:hypothetical protein
MSNEYADAVIAEARKFLGRPYVIGRFNCNTLVRKAFGNVPDPDGSRDGLRNLIGGALGNVRAFDAWAHANGRFRDASVTPEPGWVFLWGPADGTKPVRGAGHMGIVIAPKSSENPNGWALSAYNPKLGTLEHRLFPKANNDLALWGYIEPAWPIAVVDPEPPAPDDAVDPPDLAAENAALRDRLAQIAVLANG